MDALTLITPKISVSAATNLDRLHHHYCGPPFHLKTNAQFSPIYCGCGARVCGGLSGIVCRNQQSPFLPHSLSQESFFFSERKKNQSERGTEKFTRFGSSSRTTTSTNTNTSENQRQKRVVFLKEEELRGTNRGRGLVGVVGSFQKPKREQK